MWCCTVVIDTSAFMWNVSSLTFGKISHDIYWEIKFSHKLRVIHLQWHIVNHSYPSVTMIFENYCPIWSLDKTLLQMWYHCIQCKKSYQICIVPAYLCQIASVVHSFSLLTFGHRKSTYFSMLVILVLSYIALESIINNMLECLNVGKQQFC